MPAPAADARPDLESQFRERYDILRRLYEDRLRELASSVEELYVAVERDETLAALRADPTSSRYVAVRLPRPPALSFYLVTPLAARSLALVSLGTRSCAPSTRAAFATCLRRWREFARSSTPQTSAFAVFRQCGARGPHHCRSGAHTPHPRREKTSLRRALREQADGVRSQVEAYVFEDSRASGGTKADLNASSGSHDVRSRASAKPVFALQR